MNKVALARDLTLPDLGLAHEALVRTSSVQVQSGPERPRAVQASQSPRASASDAARLARVEAALAAEEAGTQGLPLVEPWVADALAHLDAAAVVGQEVADEELATEEGGALAWQSPWGRDVPPFTYLAGPAGSGKTFLTRAWADAEPGLLLCATTGIAAINLGGSTINAILGYFDTRSLQESYVNGLLTARLGKLWKCGIRRLVVDEVSMLDGDQLTYLVKAIEEVNGRGYVLKGWTDEDEGPPPALGLTLVGDFAQLPPVKAPFAWESPEWDRFAGAATHTLTAIRRQADPAFIQVLRAARRGDGRAVEAYFGDRLARDTDDAFEGPTLLAKNAQVDRYNWIRLSKVSGRDLYYESSREGKQRSEWGHPDKPPTTWGIPLRLHLKVGALVMVLANQRAEGPPPQRYLYVNGDLGEVVDGDDAAHWVDIRLQRTGQVQRVTYVERTVLQPCDAARRKELIAAGKVDQLTENRKFEIVGWVRYLPVRVAYASTVHKSQGLSLDQVQVNVSDAFFKTPGMVYVALSRARTTEGLRLVGTPAALRERCVADPRLAAWL